MELTRLERMNVANLKVGDQHADAGATLVDGVHHAGQRVVFQRHHVGEPLKPLQEEVRLVFVRVVEPGECGEIDIRILLNNLIFGHILGLHDNFT